MTSTDKQPTCAERVAASFESRTDDLKRLLDAYQDPDGAGPFYQVNELVLCGDCAPEDHCFPEPARPAVCDKCSADWPDEDGRLDDLGSFHEYGLCFDYVAPHTFNDQAEGYFRYQISYGGPSEEYRFYTSGPAFDVHRVEFWFLDWFDGAPRDCTANETVTAVFDHFRECDTLQHVYDEAAE